MDLMENLIGPITFIIIGIIAYISIFNASKHKNEGRYSSADWNYFVKKVIASYYVRKFQKSLNFVWADTFPETLLENAKIFDSKYKFDNQTIYGFDLEGNSVYFKITKRSFKNTEVVIELRFGSKIFHFPGYPDTSVVVNDSKEWEARGLHFKILQSYQTIKIFFNGLLQERGTNDLRPVTFDLIWSAVSEPTHTVFGQSKSMLVKSICLETWRDGDWLKLITDLPITGYDQYGTISGKIVFPNIICDIIHSGLRSRRFGTLIDTSRFIELTGYCDDGTYFHLGAISFTKGLTEYGSLHTSEGEERITDCDLTMEYTGNEPEGIPCIFAVNFEVGGRKFKNVFYLNKGDKLDSKLFGGNPRNMEYNIFPMHCSVRKQFGRGIAVFGYKI